MAAKVRFKNKRVEKEALFEHYKRTEAFWRHWTSTIWSMPTVASVLNIGAYTLILSVEVGLEDYQKILVLFLLLILNISLSVGLSKHIYLQKRFGKRLLSIEKAWKIKVIKTRTNCIGRFPGSYLYIVAMILICIINIGMLVYFFCQL